MNKYSKICFTLILILFLEITGWAQSQPKLLQFNGLIVRNNGVTSLALSASGEIVPLVASRKEVDNQIGRLKVNDFISFDGILSEDKKTILPQSLNYVGLSDLLGYWAGSDGFCYHFASFVSLVVDNDSANKNCRQMDSSLSTKFTYTISPGSPGWLMLLSDNKNSFLSDISLHSYRKVELHFYNAETGALIKSIRLRRQ